MYFYSMRRTCISIIFIVLPLFCFAQEDDLLEELNDLSTNELVFELPAFKALQIGNLQSTKVADQGDLYMVVAHRFGSVKGGIREFYGLDQANTKIQLLYGLSRKLQIGLSRDSYEKTYSGTAKFKLYRQSDEMPFNVTLFGSMDINTLLQKSQYPGLLFFDRFAYTSQVLISRRFSERFSLEFAPIYVRQNLQDLNFAKVANYNQFLLGIGGRFKFKKRMSLNLDYAYNFSKNVNALYKNPLTIGIDIETGGHVFQLLFTNSRASNDAAFLTEALGDWTKGEISFGFNVVRVF